MNTAPILVAVLTALNHGDEELAGRMIGELHEHAARCLAGSACSLAAELLNQMEPDERRERLRAWGLYAAWRGEAS